MHSKYIIKNIYNKSDELDTDKVIFLVTFSVLQLTGFTFFQLIGGARVPNHVTVFSALNKS